MKLVIAFAAALAAGATIPKSSDTLEVRINELVAINNEGRQDEDGDYPDWIELYNASDEARNLAGWSLTDDPGTPRKWVFPERTIPPDGFVVVFASGKDRRPPDSGPLHTNFKLSGDGEYLVLFGPDDPPQAISGFVSAFPEQVPDVAYGQRLDGGWGFLRAPTPGAPNTGARPPATAAPAAAPERGFYEGPIEIALSAAPDARLRYTLDGSEPARTNGAAYSHPLAFSKNGMLRAAAFAEGERPSPVVTHTVLIGEKERIAPLPALVITGDGETALFEPDGIMAIVGGHYVDGHWRQIAPGDYNNALRYGREFERRVSVEYIPQDGASLQIDAGVRVHGSPIQRRKRARGGNWHVCGCGPMQPDHCEPGWTSYNKFSLKLYFRAEYGQEWWRNELIPDAPVQRLRHLVLRGGSGLCDRFLHDELARRLHADMGRVAPVGALVGLYINGVYRGHYNAVLRLREPFFQEAYDSTAEWDVIDEFEVVTAGDDAAWSAMMAYATGNDLADPMHYHRLATMLDMPAFVDYLIVQLYTANTDWPYNNWTAARERTQNSRFRFHCWDMEAAFGGPNVSNFERSTRGPGLKTVDSPIAGLYRALRKSPIFRSLFDSRVKHHFGPGGALNADNIHARYTTMLEQMTGVFPDISTYVIDTFVPERKAVFLQQLAAEELYGSSQ